jgi:DNA-binding LacI/PurR family transcriptional regulator
MLTLNQLNTSTHTSIPAYVRLAEELREAVKKGEYAPGVHVASEHDLARSHALSRVTVRRATELLVAEGLLERRAGKGLYVCEAMPEVTQTVKVIVGNLAWEPSVRVARGVQQVARKYGIEIQVYDAHGSSSENLAALLSLPKNGACGAIVMALHTTVFTEAVQRVKSLGFPLVVVDYQPHEIVVPAVVADNYQGGVLAGRHLAELGHTRVAFVGDCIASTVRARLDGFRDALAEAGVVLPRGRVADITPDDPLADWGENVRQAVELLLRAEARPTAVFCSCDAVARACYRVCAALALRIPQDVSLVGFDDDPLAEWLSPPLTTVRQPFAELGKAAMTLLHMQLAGRLEKAETVTLPVEWVERGSTAWPNGN